MTSNYHIWLVDIRPYNEDSYHISPHSQAILLIGVHQYNLPVSPNTNPISHIRYESVSIYISCGWLGIHLQKQDVGTGQNETLLPTVRYIIGRGDGFSNTPNTCLMSGVVAIKFHTILPNLNEGVMAGDSIAILFFGRWVFGEGLLPDQVEEYAPMLSRQIEWVKQLVLLWATHLLQIEGRQTLARYKAMIRANQHYVLPAFPNRQR